MRNPNFLPALNTSPHALACPNSAPSHLEQAAEQPTSSGPTNSGSLLRRLAATLTVVSLGLMAASCTADVDTTPSTSAHEFEMPLPQGASLITASDLDTSIPGEVTLGSLAPDTSSVEERIPEILNRGRIIVGVEQSQYLLAYRNSATGEVEGFEVDIAKEIARDIFQNPEAIEFRFINADNWLAALTSGEVDFVINSISITRKRQDAAFFSTPYFRATSRLLVPSSSEVEDISDLGQTPVCVTQNSTGGSRVAAENPEQPMLVVTSSADCLLALQQNQAGAILSDDAILSGMMEQDPFTRLTNNTAGVEYYGIAFAKPTALRNNIGLIRQVNSTLERIFRDGTWNQLATTWLGTHLNIQNPPALFYRTETARNQLVPDRSLPNDPDSDSATTSSDGSTEEHQ